MFDHTAQPKKATKLTATRSGAKVAQMAGLLPEQIQDNLTNGDG